MRRALGGALAWLSVGHFFVVEELARRSLTLPYSRRTNYLSDLGATTCGPYLDRAICSPDHAWINVSLGVVGGGMVVGAILLRPIAPDLLRQPLSTLYVAGGVGSALVGVFPLDTDRSLHALGAGVFFVGTNLAHLLLGSRLYRRRQHAYGIALTLVGAAGLLGAALVAAGSTLGVGAGFVQRFAIYGTVLGVVASGLIVLVRQRHVESSRAPAS